MFHDLIHQLNCPGGTYCQYPHGERSSFRIYFRIVHLFIALMKIKHPYWLLVFLRIDLKVRHTKIIKRKTCYTSDQLLHKRFFIQNCYGVKTQLNIVRKSRKTDSHVKINTLFTGVLQKVIMLFSIFEIFWHSLCNNF